MFALVIGRIWRLCRVLPVAFLLLPFLPVGLVSAGTPPVISDITVTGLEDRGATIEWKTDHDADTMVNYNLESNYGIVRNQTKRGKNHKIILDALQPGTTYYFRVTSSDVEGNQAISNSRTFTTTGFEDIPIKDIEERNKTGKALIDISQIVDPEGIRIILERLRKIAAANGTAPEIIGVPKVSSIAADGAIITWKTRLPSSTEVSFATQAEYKKDAADPYALTQGKPDVRDTDHELRLIGLKPGTVYHFQARSQDSGGFIAKSDDATFKTTSPLPEITGLRLVKVEDTAATIAWDTSIPATGVVEYRLASKPTGAKTKGSRDFVTKHTVRLDGLILGTRYIATAISQNQAGEEIKGKPISFITVRDESAPTISRVTNDSTLYPTADAKVQTVVNWLTDEPAVCKFFYRSGLSENAEPVALPGNISPSVSHVQVIVEFAPSTVYKFWVSCTDTAGNEARSEDFVLFTPDKEKSIIDIILENFQGSFGWVKNIGK